eukprot:m.198292 g.198292  ORF g.198292 m.198292 type:complete len:367 (+) comp21876_c1_seq1:1128-2228(+)
MPTASQWSAPRESTSCAISSCFPAPPAADWSALHLPSYFAVALLSFPPRKGFLRGEKLYVIATPANTRRDVQPKMSSASSPKMKWADDEELFLAAGFFFLPLAAAVVLPLPLKSASSPFSPKISADTVDGALSRDGCSLSSSSGAVASISSAAAAPLPLVELKMSSSSSKMSLLVALPAAFFLGAFFTLAVFFASFFFLGLAALVMGPRSEKMSSSPPNNEASFTSRVSLITCRTCSRLSAWLSSSRSLNFGAFSFLSCRPLNRASSAALFAAASALASSLSPNRSSPRSFFFLLPLPVPADSRLATSSSSSSLSSSFCTASLDARGAAAAFLSCGPPTTAFFFSSSFAFCCRSLPCGAGAALFFF